MHKQILFIFLLISIGLLAQPSDYYLNKESKQDTNGPELSKFQFGLKISPSIAWINAIHNDVQADGATFKFGVGAIASYRIASLLSFVTGINYNGLGGYVFDNKSLNDVTIKGSYKINYSEIAIPIALKLQTPMIKKTSYFLQGGFSAGFITIANEKYYPVAANTDLIYVDISSFTSPARISYQVGAGIEYSIGKKSSFFGMIAYNNSVTNVANSVNYTSGTTPRYTSPIQLLPGSMEFSIGIIF